MTMASEVEATSSTWREFHVRDLILSGDAEVKTGPFGTQLKASEYVEDGIPVINVRNIGFGSIRKQKLEFISEETASRLSSHLLVEGDIVFGRKGAVERHAYIKSEQSRWLQGSDCLRLRLNKKIINPKFVSYLLLSEEHKAWIISQCSHGSTMASLNQDIISRVRLRVPDLNTQEKIVGVLSAYDRLIEVCSRRIELLEQIASEIFTEWFFHFRFPGYQQVEFESSSLGRVPGDWHVCSASEAIDFNPKVKIPKDGDKPFVPMGSLSNDVMVINDIESRGGNSGSKFQNGDTLFARITPCLENGKTGYVQFLPSPDSVAFGSTEFIVMRSARLSPEYVYLLARSTSFREHAIKSMTGATGRQRVQESCFSSYLLAIPPDAVLKAFSSLAAPIFEQVDIVHRKLVKLTLTRDTLLPKLASGEFDVSSLEVDTGAVE